VEASLISATICNMPMHSAHKEEESSWGEPLPREVPPPSERPFWARVKLWIGGMGLALCGLLWLVEIAFLFLPDPMDGVHLNGNLTLLTVLLLLTVFFLVIVRSGLRGPTDPLAPHEGTTGVQWRTLPLPLPQDEGKDEDEDKGPGPEQLNPPKKPHLRLVRPAP
jgi:hypothetical protein